MRRTTLPRPGQTSAAVPSPPCRRETPLGTCVSPALMCSLRYKRTDVIVHSDGFWQVSVSVTTVQIEEEDLPQRSPAPRSLHLPPRGSHCRSSRKGGNLGSAERCMPGITPCLRSLCLASSPRPPDFEIHPGCVSRERFCFLSEQHCMAWMYRRAAVSNGAQVP